MRKVLKKVDEDLFIFGTDFTGVGETFSITDDYCSITIKTDDEPVNLETVGFVFIYTLSELKEVFDKMSEDEQDELEDYCIMVKDYKGEVLLSSEEDYDMTSLDLSDYIQHQADTGEWLNIQVELDINSKRVQRLTYLELTKIIKE